MSTFDIVVNLDVICDEPLPLESVRYLDNKVHVLAIMTDILHGFDLLSWEFNGEQMSACVRSNGEFTDAGKSDEEMLRLIFDAEFACDAWAEGDISLGNVGHFSIELWPTLESLSLVPETVAPP